MDNTTKTLALFVPYAEFNQPGFAPGEFVNPLVARIHTYTRYEIRLNWPEDQAIAASGWSVGRNLPDAAHPADLPIGSIAVKASWRILTDADTPAVRARYYVVRDANVVDVAKSLAAGKIACSKSDIALVGMHVMVKTRYRPQWLWSTFEHVDNVPPAGEGEAREPDARGSRRALFLFDRRAARSPTASPRFARRPSQSAWPIPPSSAPSRCRSLAAIPSMPRRWR